MSLDAWLLEELVTKHRVPRKIGKSWIENNEILPLLDGLDEVAESARAACVQAIEAYHVQIQGELVVCCRRQEYLKLPRRLTLQRAVCVQQMSDHQVEVYLQQAEQSTPGSLQGLRQALSGDSELNKLAHRPLMLNVFTFAYQGVTVAEIPTGKTPEEMLPLIFEQYVDRMLKRRTGLKRWKSGQVIHWLAFLAKQMKQHNQTVFFVKNLQPTWLPRDWRIRYQCCGGLVVGLVAWAVLRLVGGPVMDLMGLVSGLFLGLVFGIDRGINPAEALVWNWKAARSGLFSGLVGGLVIGLVSGLVGGVLLGLLRRVFLGPLLGPLLGLLLGLLLGVLLGVIFMPIFGLRIGQSRRQLPEHLSFSPNEAIWYSAKNGLLVWLLFGVLPCLIFGSILALIFGLRIELRIGLSVESLYGLSFGLFFGLQAFANHFILRFFLSRLGNLPWDLVEFLDEATKRLLLRKVGGSYIFVHQLLLDYFVDLERKDRSKL